MGKIRWPLRARAASTNVATGYRLLFNIALFTHFVKAFRYNPTTSTLLIRKV